MPVDARAAVGPPHGDYATNVALRLAGRAPAAAARGRGGARGRASAALDGVAAVEVAGPGLPQPHRRRCLARARRSRRSSPQGDAFGGGSAATPERIQVELVSANPTGPITVASARNGAYGDAVARLLAFAGHDVEREYYYNDAGAQMDRFRASVEAVRRGEEPPEDGYQGDYVAELAREDGRPGAADARADRGVARAVPHPLRHASSARASSRRRSPRRSTLLDTYEADGALWARTTAHGDDKDRVRRPLGRDADVLRRRRRLRPAQVREGLRPAHLRARRRPPRVRRRASRRSPRCSATRASRSRC